jgi:hypothetical protein
VVDLGEHPLLQGKKTGLGKKAARFVVDGTIDRKVHEIEPAQTGCAIGLGLALGSMEKCPDVEAGIVHTVPEEDVDLTGSEVAVEHKGSEAGLDVLGKGYGSGDSGSVVGFLGPPTGYRCGWRP